MATVVSMASMGACGGFLTQTSLRAKTLEKALSQNFAESPRTEFESRPWPFFRLFTVASFQFRLRKKGTLTARSAGYMAQFIFCALLILKINNYLYFVHYSNIYKYICS